MPPRGQVCQPRSEWMLINDLKFADSEVTSVTQSSIVHCNHYYQKTFSRCAFKPLASSSVTLSMKNRLFFSTPKTFHVLENC